MDVVLNGKKLGLKKGARVTDALAATRINPETILVKRNGGLIPHDAPLKDGDSLETIKVISGG
jgi:sulfur carrier protein ThiS